MEYSKFKDMVNEVKEYIKDCAKYHWFLTKKDIANFCCDFVVTTWFWDYYKGAPTCDVDQMAQVIKNTVQKELKTRRI